MHNKIKFEINQIDKELSEYQKLLKKIKNKDPDKIEKAALATILHSFYTGIEKIFKIIAKEKYGYYPSSKRWHKDLLEMMNNKIITEELFNKLIEYLSFRHLYRNSYEFNLNWKEMKGLVINIEKVWAKLKEELKEKLYN